MVVKRMVWIGAALSLAGGLALASVVASSQDLERVDDRPMTVPIGRVGDQVAYASFERDDEDGEWRTAPVWDYYAAGQHGFKVASLGATKDGQAMMRDAVFVVLDAREGSLDVGPGGVQFHEEWDYTHGFHLDLEGRSILSHESNSRGASIDTMAVAGGQANSRTWYDPGWRVISPQGDYRGIGQNGILYELAQQGRTYELGQDLGLHGYDLYWQFMNWVFEGHYPIEDFEHRAWVADRRVVNGHDAYDLRTVGCFSLGPAVGAYDWMMDDQEFAEKGITFLHTRMRVGSHACYTVDTWVTDDLPYPLLITERAEVDGVAHEWMDQLAAYTPGTGAPIPWGTGGRDASRDPNGVESGAPIAGLESTPLGQKYPADGTQYALGFPSAAAIANVLSDPTLRAFHEWRGNNPDAQLIGMQMYPASGGGQQWDLVYGVSAGKAFVASSILRPGLAVAFQAEDGPFDIPPFYATDFPDYPITIAGVTDLWVEHARTTDGGLPNFVQWAASYHTSVLRCSAVTVCEPGETGVNSGNPSALAVGHIAESGVTPWQADTIDYLEVFAITPRLWWSTATFRDYSFAPLSVAGARPLDSPDARAVDGDHFGVPQLGPAVILSTSFLAAFLAIYYLPAIRTMGWLPFVGSYARITQDQVLVAKTRDGLHDLVRRNPGMTTAQLVEAFGTPWTTTRYHLGVLEKNSLVSSLVDGRHKRFFPNEGMAWHGRYSTAVLLNANTKGLFDLIVNQPGIIHSELARRIGVSSPAIYWHVERLEAAGLVSHQKQGRSVHYFPATNGRVASSNVSAEAS